jgi:hypothetical protein
MRENLQKNLKSIFAGKKAVFITDDPHMADWLTTAWGLEVMRFDQLLADNVKIPSCAIALPLDYERIPSRQMLRKTLSKTSVLWIPLASFSSDLDVAKYSVEMFAASDVDSSVAKNRRVITKLLLAQKEITMSGPGTELHLRLPDTLKLVGRTRLTLLPDEHSALGNYSEVALSPTDLAGHIDTELTVSGTFRINSVLAAKHREFKGPAAALSASKVADEMRRACPLQVTIRNNKIVDGLGKWSDSLEAMCGPQDSKALTEIAIGTSIMPLDRVDWSLNTVVNEGATGVHIGTGNGINGIHFDFISTETRLDGI